MSSSNRYRATERVLEVWAPPEFISDGENGIQSWTGSTLYTPTGLRMAMDARTVQPNAPSLRRDSLAVSALADGIPTRVGWSSHSSDTHARITLTLPDLDPNAPSADIELTVDDPITNGPWIKRLIWPSATRHSAPLTVPEGRLALLTDPVILTGATTSIETWIGPVVLDPHGIEFLYSATALDEHAPSIWDYRGEAVLHSQLGTWQITAGESTSATRTVRTFQVPLPDDIAEPPPWHFQLTVTDHTAGLTHSTEFSWNGTEPRTP